MKTTYNEILDSMRSAYYEKCGERAELQSDIGARFQAVASELFSLACYGDYILKQAFAQSATGVQLDFHAALRDIKRKSASAAQGELMFYISEPTDADIEIPKGTICSASDKPFLQFVTTEKAVLKAGEAVVRVAAEANQAGSEFNAPAHSIRVMVNPPAGIEGVENEDDFSGGCDTENDGSLRKRILNSYRIPQTGYSPKSVRELILKDDEVIDCAVYFEYSKYNIYLKTRSGKVSDALKNRIRNSLVLLELTPYTLKISAAVDSTFNLTVDIKVHSSEADRVKAEIEEKINKICSGIAIGENINLNQLSYSLSGIEGAEYCEIASENALGGVIYSSENRYLKLNSLQVICHE